MELGESMATGIIRQQNFCLGCGCNTAPSDTRTLHSDDAKEVMSTWTAFVSHVCESQKESAAFIHCNGDPSATGKMCRKCFSMYSRFSKLQAVIEDGISEAIKVAVPSATPFKRPRLNAHTHNQECILTAVSGSSRASPEVAVIVALLCRTIIDNLYHVDPSWLPQT